MKANTIRLTEQRDEAQSQIRSLETDVRLLRAALEEAVGLLRDASDVINLQWHDKRRRFLATLDEGDTQ